MYLSYPVKIINDFISQTHLLKTVLDGNLARAKTKDVLRRRINPCLNSPCRQQEDCSLNPAGIPVCSCPSPCDPVFKPVCGSDGRTYENECEVRRNSCLSKKNIDVAYYDGC
ncbi:hypothetical protein QYM36_006385, partial [Artemia franciscana]